eukprot:gb/GECG01008471.1/.p1 GENE.gb/GECG01008471.1/~~gb/GECG01008471.1/.p1  ORF type:complete len:190 (+),score=22.95 gb/GECG01008471.1/:1-570(+)
MQKFQENVNNLLKDRMRVLWYTWIVMLVFIVCFIISGFVAASDADSKSFSFAVVWLALIAAGYSIGGSLLLRKVGFQTPLALGMMIGVTFMMAMQMITLAVLAIGNAGDVEGGTSSSEDAVGAFTILLFIVLLVMNVMLVMFRSTLLPPDSMASQDTHVPPGEGYPGEYSGQGTDTSEVNVESEGGNVM